MKPFIPALLFCILASTVGLSQEENPYTNSEYKHLDKETKVSDSTFLKNKIRGRINRNVKRRRTNTYVIEYDFQDGVFKRNQLKLKVSTPTVFKITNVNRLAYDVKITSKDSMLSGTFLFDSPDSQLIEFREDRKELGTATTESISTDKSVNTINQHEIKQNEKNNQDNISSDLDKVSKLNSLTEERQEKINDIDKAFRLLELKQAGINKQLTDSGKDSLAPVERKQKFDRINAIIDEINKNSTNPEFAIAKLEALQKDYTEDDDNIVMNLKRLYDSLKKIDEEIEKVNDIKNEALRKFNNDQQKLIASFTILKNSYLEILHIQDYFKEVTFVTSNSSLTLENYQNKYKKYKKSMDSIYSNIQFTYESIRAFREESLNFEVSYTYLNYNPSLDDVFTSGGINKLYSLANNLKDIVAKMNKNLEGLPYERMLDYMKKNIPLLNEETTYIVESSSFQPIQDVAIFNVDIKKRKYNKSTIYSEQKFSHKEFTYGGTRFDVSIGLAGSYFPDANQYELTTTDNSIKIHKKSGYTFSSSMIGLVTMSYRNTKYVTYGASAGLGIDVTNGKIQLGSFYFGPSLIFGKYDRLTLTAGASVKNVYALKGGFDIEETYPLSNNSIDIQNYLTDKFSVGGFTSLTYNLTKGVKDNANYVKTLL